MRWGMGDEPTRKVRPMPGGTHAPLNSVLLALPWAADSIVGVTFFRDASPESFGVFDRALSRCAQPAAVCCARRGAVLHDWEPAHARPVAAVAIITAR